MYDVEVIKENKVIAKSKCKCDTCNSVIFKGEIYDEQINLSNSEIYKWKNCEHCKEIREDAYMYYYNKFGKTSLSSYDFYNFIDDMNIKFSVRI